MTSKYFRTLTLTLVLLGAGVALAAVTFEPATGEGFVGKGDVQLAFGWNNRELQSKAGGVTFQATSTVVTEVSWICTNDKNEKTQERERTTTTTIEGILSSIARERNQITGFDLTGYSGEPTESSTTEGNVLNSCPSGPSWALTTPAGEPEVVSSSSTLLTCYSGSGCVELLQQ